MRIRFTLVLILVEVYSMSVVAFLRKSIRRDLISRRCASSLFPPQHQQVQQAFLTYTSKFVDIPDVDGSERAMHYLDLYPEPGTVFEEGKPPIVLLGGASQTVHTFSLHYADMLRKTGRRIIVPEMRCQGKTELLSKHGTMKQHVADFVNLCNKLKVRKVDLVGFSFGSRISLGVSAHQSAVEINKLSLTGVAKERGALGNLVIESWRRALKNGNIEEAAWAFILNGYSEKFLMASETRVAKLVDMVVKVNDAQRLSDMMTYSHVNDPEDPYSIQKCLEKICFDGKFTHRQIQCLAAGGDRIASAQGTRNLVCYLNENITVADAGVEVEVEVAHEEFAGIGHLLPFEKPAGWRNSVLKFLEQS